MAPAVVPPRPLHILSWSFVRKLEPIVAVTVLALVGACATGISAPGGAPGAPAPPAAVERFLQFARDKDYAAMGWVFGTANGPVIRRDPVAEVEERMYALASLLEHDGFTLNEGSPVPGRTGEAVRFDVTLRRGFRTREVPFTVVRGPEGRWYVEQLAVEALTQ